jgi:hypothetical protein
LIAFQPEFGIRETKKRGGYPSFRLLFTLKAGGMEFCVRLKEDWWLKVKDFVRCKEKGRIVRFTLPGERAQQTDRFSGISTGGQGDRLPLGKS